MKTSSDYLKSGELNLMITEEVLLLFNTPVSYCGVQMYIRIILHTVFISDFHFDLGLNQVHLWLLFLFNYHVEHSG